MKKNLPVLIEAAIAGILVFLLTFTNALSSLDYIAKDKLYQSPRGIDSDIKIIGIDEKTLDEYGPIQTWSRSMYADLLNTLNSDENMRPAVIGFDIVFAGNVDDSDSKFAEAVKSSGNVVLVNTLIYSKVLTYDEDGVPHYLDKVVDSTEPYAELVGAAAGIGYSNVSMDSDGTVRRVIPVESYNGQDCSMFSKVLYEEYCRQTGASERTIKTDKKGRSLINYSGEPGDYEYISMADVLSGKIDSRAFADSIVIVGAYAQGMQDNFKVPNGGSSQMYGVEIHANIFQSYMDGLFAVNGDPVVLGLITAVLVIILHILFRKLKIWQSIIILAAAIGGYVLLVMKLNESGTAYNVIYFPLILLICFIYSVGMHYFVERAKKKKVLSAFRKYVAPQIVEEIAKKGDFEIKLGGENRDIAVLFVDIRGFTTMSEALEPEKVVEILNEYLSLTTKAIFDNSGTLDKFVGDATMAVFNSPFDLPDYEFKAVCAAMDIVKGGEALEKELLEKYGRTVGFGVGVHCGPAVVGNVGCEFRMDFTAIGDTVNTSARLEANAKKGQVLISDTLYERLKDRIEVNEIGQIPLKGKSNGVMVYEVTEVKRS